MTVTEVKCRDALRIEPREPSDRILVLEGNGNLVTRRVRLSATLQITTCNDIVVELRP